MHDNDNQHQIDGVSLQQAQLIHQLLGQAFESSLRQQLISGEFNAAMLGKILEWLKVNNITCSEDADESLSNMRKIFVSAKRKGESIDDILADITSTQI